MGTLPHIKTNSENHEKNTLHGIDAGDGNDHCCTEKS